MSVIATLDKLESHLSHAPGYQPASLPAQNRTSALESFFSEIRYSSFRQDNADNSGNGAKVTLSFKVQR